MDYAKGEFTLQEGMLESLTKLKSLTYRLIKVRNCRFHVFRQVDLVT